MEGVLMLHYFKLNCDKLVSQSEQTGSTLWIHVEQPTSEEIHLLTKQYELPKDYLTSILDDAENSRAEGLQQVTFKRSVLLLLQFPLVSKSPSGYEEFFTYPLSLILTPQKQIITVSNYPLPFMNSFFQQLFTHDDTEAVMHLFLSFLWQIVISFNKDLMSIKEQLDSLEQQIRVSTENNQLFRIMDIQKSLVLFDTATTANFDTLKKLEMAPFFQKNHAYENHLHDILIETKQAMTSANIHLKFANQMNDTFSAVVSNNQNNIMKILTSLTIVLTIPTIVSGLYGMNVSLPIENRADAFWILLAVTLVICYLTIRYLKKKGLL